MTAARNARRLALTIATFAVALVPLARSQETAKPLLWKIESAAKKPSYLFGTIHLTRPAVTKLAPQVLATFDASDAVYTEIPADFATMLSATQSMMMPDGKTLTDVLPDDVLEKLSAELAAINPMFSLDVFNQFKPWAIAASLMVLEDQMKYPGALALDMVLYQRAAIAGKTTGGLETIDEQLGVFDGFSEAEQIQMLSETVNMMRADREKGTSSLDLLVSAYLAGDLDKVEAEMEKWNAASEDPKLTEKFMERLLYKRNVHMADRIAALIRENPDTGYFFAIGAAHLGTDRGVLKLLEKAGFKISRVE